MAMDEEDVNKILARHGTSEYGIVMMDDDELFEEEKVPEWLIGFDNVYDAAKYWYEQYKMLDDLVLDVSCLQID